MAILEEGQFQIGDVVFGKRTNILVTTFTKESYEIQSADLPLARTDEIRFGKDSFTPTPITFELAVLDNYDVFRGPAYPIGVPADQAQQTLANEWRADGVRGTWNAQKPLYYCQRGSQRVVFGRPRKFTQAWARRQADYLPIVAEYQPVDPLSYGATEYGATVTATATGVMPGAIVRSGGSVEGWCRFVINGPINHPIIELSNGQKIDINYNVPAGVVVEISSYPWTRRIVTSTGLSLAANLLAGSPYLDEIRTPPNATMNFGLHGAGTTGATSLIALWREAYATL